MTESDSSRLDDYRFQMGHDLIGEQEPMQTLRASAIALPFVGLALLVGVLSILMGVPT